MSKSVEISKALFTMEDFTTSTKRRFDAASIILLKTPQNTRTWNRAYKIAVKLGSSEELKALDLKLNGEETV